MLHDDAKLVLVFCSDAYDLPALLQAINDETGDVPLIGCSTAGEISSNAATLASVVITVLGGAGFSCATAAAGLADSGPAQAGAAVAACAPQDDPEGSRILLMLIDGLAPQQEEILLGAYGVLGAGVPLVGGAAADDLKMGRTAQLHGREVLYGSVVAASVDSDADFGIGVQHGWRQVGEAMMVTRAAGGRVYTLNDEPALDAYLDRLNAPAETYVDDGAFQRFAMTRPLSVRRRQGSEVRGVNAQADFDDRSLGCGGEIPHGGLTWVMEGDAESVLAATDVACRDALDGLTGPPVGVIAFDCIARRDVLGTVGLADEVARITAHAGAATVSGFYTYGEIARTQGINGFHHQTLVVLAIG